MTAMELFKESESCPSALIYTHCKLYITKLKCHDMSYCKDKIAYLEKSDVTFSSASSKSHIWAIFSFKWFFSSSEKTPSTPTSPVALGTLDNITKSPTRVTSQSLSIMGPYLEPKICGDGDTGISDLNGSKEGLGFPGDCWKNIDW